LKNLDFSTREEFEQKIEVLNKNKQKIEIYLMGWFVVGIVAAVIIFSFPPTPIAAVFAFVLPIFSCSTQLIEYGNAIEKIEAAAEESGV